MHYTPHAYGEIDQALFFEKGVDERIRFLRMVSEYCGTLPLKTQAEFRQAADLGTVTGFYPAAFLWLGMEAFAVNRDGAALRYLRDNVTYSPSLEGRVHLVQADIRRLPFPDASVDLVTIMTGTFSHLPKGGHETALEECARVIPSGKCLVISDWNIAHPQQDFFGVYTEEQQQELRGNHLGYPYLLEALHAHFTPRLAYLHSGKKMYMVLATRN